MSLAVRYYTKGGNTKKLAMAIEEAVEVQAKTVDVALEEKVDVLLLGCSYYAFDMDPEVKKFIKENASKIGKIVLFGTSAMIKSMKKPLNKVLKDTGASILVDYNEFHCPGSFKFMHKGRPNADDIAAIKVWAKQYKGL